MKTKCPLCEEGFINILEHISIKHNISTIEDYKKKVKEGEDKKNKINAFLRYSEELTKKCKEGEISGERLRELRAKWEKDNDLKW